MRNRALVLLSISLLIISIILGGCSDMQIKTATTKSNYPEKPIITIVPFSVGGGMDLTARSLEMVSLKYLGQPLVIMNKPGGAGTIGWNELAGASPDGYTIGTVAIDILISSLLMASKYNYPTALEPLAQISSPPMVLGIRADQPWENLDELLEYAKQNPGKLKCGNGGVGSIGHIVGEMFGQSTKIKIEQVPFTGGSEQTAALLGGHVQLIFITPAALKEQVKSGKIRILALSGEHRLTDPLFTSIPTFKEKGIDITVTNWYGIAVPKEMPIKDKTKLAEGLKASINDPEFMKRMDSIGLPVEYLGPEESQAKWQSDSQKLQKALQESGILEQIKSQKK
jgi:tripartite-type tricarboxylate transporter receptor subunit TctC